MKTGTFIKTKTRTLFEVQKAVGLAPVSYSTSSATFWMMFGIQKKAFG